MNWKGLLLALIFCLPGAMSAASAKVHKVLPHYFDFNGAQSLAPSLFERDAYQAYLRRNPTFRSGLQVDINWKAHRGTYLLKAELRGTKGNQLTTKTLQKEIVRKKFFSQWDGISFSGTEYAEFGELSAWRVTVWKGDELVAEHKSFLW